MSLRNGLLSLLLFVASLALASSLIRSLVPWASDDELAARMLHFDEHKDDYEVLYFGTSTVRRSIIPEVIDARLRQRGHPLRSFNLGLPQAFQHEIDFLVGEVLERQPRRLRYVLIELLYMSPDRLLGRGNDFTDRVVSWHTPRHTFGIYRSMLRGDEPLYRYLPAALQHARHALWRLTNFGQGERIVGEWGDGARRRAEADAVAATRGYEPLDVVTGELQARSRRYFLGHIPQYLWRVARIDAVNAQPASIEKYDAQRIRDQIERIRAAGAEPVFVITPIDQPTPGLLELRRQGVLPHLIAFNSPRRYPELYVVEHRYDDVHVNAQGARILSELLADRFADFLDGRADP